MRVETKRLLILPVELKEAEAVTGLITSKISEWTSPIPWPYRIDDAKTWINTTDPAKRLGIYLLSSQKLIGAASMPTFNGDEIGFWINDSYEGNGYATEAAAAVATYVFTHTDLDFLESSVHQDNAPSKRVHEKLGFTVIAEEERYWSNRKEMVPVLVYRLDRTTWRNRTTS